MSDSSDNPAPDTSSSGSDAYHGVPSRRRIGNPPTTLPSWHNAQLRRWLYEWSIYRALASEEVASKEDLHEMSSASVEASPMEETGIQLPPGFVPPYESTPESFEPGAVRLLDSKLVPDASRPVYILILADWADGLKLIAPFGPFSVPGSTMELRTNSEEPYLAVVSLWNQRVVSAETLKQSWFVERFDQDGFDDILTVWQNGILGDVLPARLHPLIGPPIERQDDPRCLYQNEEAEIFAALDARTLNVDDSETHSDTDGVLITPSPTFWNELSFYDEVAAWHEEEELKRAAKSRSRAPSWEAWYEIVGTGLQLCLATHLDQKTCDITVVHSDKEIAHGFEAQFIPSNGKTVAIVHGRAVCPISVIGQRFGFFDKHGNELRVTPMTQA